MNEETEESSTSLIAWGNDIKEYALAQAQQGVHFDGYKPKIGQNQFGGESVTYEGIGATKKWERLESYGPKFVENIVQAISRDILMNSMRSLRRHSIVAHVHDEMIITSDGTVSFMQGTADMKKTS